MFNRSSEYLLSTNSPQNLGNIVDDEISLMESIENFSKNCFFVLATLTLLYHRDKLINFSVGSFIVNAITHYSCPEFVKFLLKFNPKYFVNVRDDQGFTLLHSACRARMLKHVKLLLLDGEADPNATCKYGNTPLHLACKAGNLDIVKLLIAHGANIESRNENNETPFFVSVEYDERKIVEFFLRKNAHIDTQDWFGDTALHCCVDRYNKPMLNLLLSHNIDTTKKNKMHYIAMDNAMNNDDVNSSILLMPSFVLARRQGRKFTEETIIEINYDKTLQKLHDDCQKELETSCSTFVPGTNVSFYKILTVPDVHVYMRNENVRKLIDSEFNVHEHFPIYGDTIKRRLTRGFENMKLLEKCYMSFNELVKRELPLLCLEKIFSYFSDYELSTFGT